MLQDIKVKRIQKSHKHKKFKETNPSTEEEEKKKKKMKKLSFVQMNNKVKSKSMNSH